MLYLLLFEHLFEIFGNCFLEIAENEENNKTNPVTPPPSSHSSWVVYIVYTICIFLHNSVGTGLKKEVYLQSSNVYLSNQKSYTPFRVSNVSKSSKIVGSAFR